MDHHYIKEQNIPDRYLLGKLPPEERARFEEHFIDCQECLDRLETTEDFRQALRSVAAEDATRGYAQAGLLARIMWIARLSSKRRAALLFAAILLLAALPTALWIKERGRADDAQFTSTELQRKYDESQQRAQQLERPASQLPSAEQRGQLEAQLERERQERVRLANELEQLKRPRGAPPVFILSIARGDRSGEPVNRIVLPRSAPRITLSLELEPDPDLQSYRATLQTADNRELWSSSNLRPNSKDTLRLGFNTEIFKPGDYLITLEGLTAQGRYVPAAKYSFRAAKKE